MKIKIRLSIFLLFIGYFLLSTTYAQDLQLGNIDLSFCNNQEISNELDLTAKAGETIPICINFTNTSTENTTINVDFLDSSMTQETNGEKLRACNGGDRPKEHFGNFVLDYDKDKVITIKGNSTLQKTYKIKLPIGFKGLSHGCVAYNVVKEGEAKSMLNIVVRNIKFVDIYVGETQIKSQIEIGSIKTIKNGKTTNLQILLKNIGNISQNISFSGTISNIFGFKQTLKFNQDSFTIPPNEEIKIQTNNEKLTLPIYKGLFSVNFKINNRPNFDFNIKEKDSIPQEVILGGNFEISKFIFITNPYFIGLIVIFLILIYLSIFKKRKKIIISNDSGIQI